MNHWETWLRKKIVLPPNHSNKISMYTKFNFAKIQDPELKNLENEAFIYTEKYF